MPLYLQVLIDAGALPALRHLLNSPDEKIQDEVCHSLTRLVRGSEKHIDAVIKADIVCRLIYLLADMRFYAFTV